MASILLAGSAAYVVVKWRIVLPAVVESVRIAVGSPDGPVSQYASPVFIAVTTGVVAGYAAALQDDLLPFTPMTEIAYALVVVALITLMWTDNAHWQIASLHMATVLTARLTTLSAWWAVGTVGFAAIQGGVMVKYICAKD